MTKQEWYEHYMNDNTEYCCYCGNQRYSFSCCGEIHFETFRNMMPEAQEVFLSYEDYTE
jgi:hypothetical protein